MPVTPRDPITFGHPPGAPVSRDGREPRNERHDALPPSDRQTSSVTGTAAGTLSVNRVGRSVRLAGLAGRTVANRAHTAVRSRAGGDAAEAAVHASQARLADRYAEVLGDMKGAIMKVGQILSFVDAPGLLPGSAGELFQSALARLQDDVPPLGPDEIAEVIEAELGARPNTSSASSQPGRSRPPPSGRYTALDLRTVPN